MPYNTANSIDACGECGHRCENGKVCTDGACVSGQGSMYCDDILINTFSDSANSNGCDNNCAQGYSCSNGSCQTYTFNSSYTLTCDGETVYPYNDSSNCGKCGNDCGKGKYCKAGFCTTEPTTLSTTTYCDGILVEPYADFSNCGGCGISCSATQICFAGTCKSKSNLVIGDIIVFGHYEQDNDKTNGKEPITWRILDINASGQYLLISEKALDVQPYNTTRIDITWEKSTIRSWLNGYDADSNSAEKSYISDYFIDAAFTDKEKNKIQSVDVPAHANPNYNTPPGNATNDKIFLLSITEAQSYFTVDATRQAEATRVAVKKVLLFMVQNQANLHPMEHAQMFIVHPTGGSGRRATTIATARTSTIPVKSTPMASASVSPTISSRFVPLYGWSFNG